ncbi:MAG TPA: hypothetical protein O0X81_03905, partial [Methanocorpusculum sp.]|nr:hypothetical protein [Methanocorpusculum sp.]
PCAVKETVIYWGAWWVITVPFIERTKYYLPVCLVTLGRNFPEKFQKVFTNFAFSALKSQTTQISPSSPIKENTYIPTQRYISMSREGDV